MPHYRVSKLLDRISTATVTDRLEWLAEILDKIEEYEVEESRLPPKAREVVGELMREGIRFEWPLTVEELKETEIGGLPQKVWLRAASKASIFERAAMHAAFIRSIPHSWELAYGI